jgi:DNA repair protein RadC
MSQPLKKSIKDWDEKDKPREKLLAQGRGNLSNAELIAILMGSGNRELSAVELARQILESCGNNLNELAKMTVSELMKFKGVGEAKAISVAAALELGRRRLETEVVEKPKITNSKDVFKYMFPELGDKPYEEFWIVLLNRANRIITRVMISSGGMAGSVVDAKKVFKLSIEKNASSIILVHNHPSGNLTPSSGDIEITKKLKAAGKLLDIQVLDHLIIGDNKFYSFVDREMI